ncbi:MAG: hypothetical protein COA50_07210 [Flavobacteriaceae bacterium]|nr:MAG: hypothetical protein COA50_07210 [Flavobacteriaceae bacterium]
MNPSASGWIDKFGSLVDKNPSQYASFSELYNKVLKDTGFIYGINVSIPESIVIELELTEDEKAKINLLYSLYYTYTFTFKEVVFDAFIECVFQFYETLDIASVSFLDKILTGKKTSSQLEKLINSRIYLDDNVISKTFNSIITNSFLFMDVLIFNRYLDGVINIKDHAQHLEHKTINLAFHAFNTKETRNVKDKKLSQLFASSLTFVDGIEKDFHTSYDKNNSIQFSVDENSYFLDVICLTVWEDQSLDFKESEFIFEVGKDLGFSPKIIKEQLENIVTFFEINADKIPHLKDHNLAYQFYDSMSKIVKKLILRNSKRLQKELSESKELVTLLSKSTVKELTEEEKRKIQNQLLDIFKSIPSLAIFLLPGGAVLLPIFIKLIPKLLPSAFDDNRVD